MAFLSHFKVEAATEARWLQGEMEERLNLGLVFLDSDDLLDLTQLKEHVRQSTCILLIQTRSVLTRPWCIVELITAIEAGVPIIGVSITSGTAPYDHGVAAEFMTFMDSRLDADTQEKLVALGIDPSDAAFVLSSTLPNIISVPLNMNESRGVLSARVDDIVASMNKAVLPKLPDKAAWIANRQSANPRAQPAHGWRSHTKDAAIVPPEVPALPRGAVSRPDIIAALKERVLRSGGSVTSTTTVTAPPAKASGFFSAFVNMTTAAGMGGVGKTMTAAALVRDETVLRSFDKICWVSVGQEPDTPALQQTLHIQILGLPLSEYAKADERVALEALRTAAQHKFVLLVLDDVWQAAHTTPLNFVDSSAGSGSAVVVTTRMRNLLDGASEVQCTVLSVEASLELLLRAGGCDEKMFSAPPPAAREAVELCGRLPLALSLAGGIIEELGSTWQAGLVTLLKDELGGEADSVEERVVSASLRIMPTEMRTTVDELFVLFAIYPEDALIPDTAIDAIASLVPSAAGGGVGGSSSAAGSRGTAQTKRRVRRAMQLLLKANIVRGSLDGGVSVHDLVRDVMIRRAEATREGGLRQTQRAAVPLLLAAFEAGGSVASYVSEKLHWHVRQCQQPKVAVHSDPLLMSLITHHTVDVRKQAALGIGVEKLREAANACDASGSHLEAASLMWAACALRSVAAGAEAKAAWQSLKQLEAAGRGSVASRELESTVLSMLSSATSGGYVFGSEEHASLLKRMDELASGQATFSSEIARGINALMATHAIEGIAGYAPVTPQAIRRSNEHVQVMVQSFANAAAAAPNESTAVAMGSWWSYSFVHSARTNALPEFAVPDRAKLIQTIEAYNFETCHPAAKAVAFTIDIFMFDVEPHSLLLFHGDLAGARTGWAKILDAHKKVLAKVRAGTAAVEAYSFEAVCSIYFIVPSLLYAGEVGLLRDLLEDSLLGAALRNEGTIREGLASWFQGAFAGWSTDDGHCLITFDTWMHAVRGVAALVLEEKGGPSSEKEARRAALKAWLPSPTELLHIAEYQCGWRGHALGGTIAPLLLAKLHGEQLGDWAAVVQVTEGVLALEAHQPLLRAEAYRLLGRARAALGQSGEAHEAAERAAAEAKAGHYVWLEWLSTRDLARAGGVNGRLKEVEGRMQASAAELSLYNAIM